MGKATHLGVITLLARLSKVALRRSSEGLLGMSHRQFHVLVNLRDRGPMAQQELCLTLLMDANNLVLLLNELESLGWIHRRRDPGDRRRHIVELTPDGERALQAAEKAQETTEDEVLAALSREERAALRDLLTRALEGALNADRVEAAGTRT